MPELTPEQRNAIKAMLAEGRSMEAIKSYREFTGSGLKESKDWVDAYHQELAKEQPELYQRKSGCCLGLILLVISLGAAAGLAGSAVTTWL